VGHTDQKIDLEQATKGYFCRFLARAKIASHVKCTSAQHMANENAIELRLIATVMTRA